MLLPASTEPQPNFTDGDTVTVKPHGRCLVRSVEPNGLMHVLTEEGDYRTLNVKEAEYVYVED